MTVIRISLFAFFYKRFADQLNVEYKDLNTNKTYPKGQPNLLHYTKVNIDEGWLVKQTFIFNLNWFECIVRAAGLSRATLLKHQFLFLFANIDEFYVLLTNCILERSAY